ncbi:MAG: tetratricopeptide repeat protein [Anaerolineae bacterium]|nr:tetratricopeptide repeat protein [Anaerolineae bacterium]
MNSQQEILSKYAGARVTRLIDREEEMTRIRAAVAAPSQQGHLFYFEADGGMGKTFLARELLRRFAAEASSTTALPLLVAEREIDLYHHQTHSREGFMAEFVAVLGEEHFPTYCQKRDELEKVRYDLYGAINELQQARATLTQAFLADCERLNEQQRPVLVLDTAEKIVYETDRVQQALGLGSEAFDLLPWLLNEWLPRMLNAVVLLCGRPRERLENELPEAAKRHGLPYTYRKLDVFSEAETLEYFAAVRETAVADQNEQAVKWLDNVSEDARRTIHLLTGGRPILVALFIDYYLVSGHLLPELQAPLSKLQAKNPAELAKIRKEVERQIVGQFRNLTRPADALVEALAWAPKGADAALLARIAGLGKDEAVKVLIALSDPTTGLSFVKVRWPDRIGRPEERRAFLHDEMYKLMKKHALDPTPAQAQAVSKIILDYYAEEIQKARQEVARLSQEREEIPPDGRIVIVSAPGRLRNPQAMARALDRLRDLQVEKVYYCLQADPQGGFAAYCEVADEAIMANDDELDMQLRAEMLEFAANVYKEGRTEVGGLRQGDVERRVALDWVWRNLYRSLSEDAWRVAQHLREREAAFLDKGAPLTWAELTVGESWAAAFRGVKREELQSKEAELRCKIEELKGLVPQSDFEKWRRDVLLAKAHNVHGYLLRVCGNFAAACAAYERALPLWRKLKREIDHAETLNNLSWALAEFGLFGRAERRCQDGLDLRKKMGRLYLLGLSYNTLGLIATKNNQPHRGQTHCGRALAIFRELGVLRGMGLAYTALAEANRRRADVPDLFSPKEAVERLQVAEECAQYAVDIFRGPVPEKLRLVEALIELGCIYRNWARVWPEYHEEGPDQETLIHQSEAALREAAALAADPFPYRQIDALVNLAWLYYYVKQPEQAAAILDHEVQPIIPDEYFIREGKGEPLERERLHSFFWTQLGKAEMLRGLIAHRQYDDKPSIKDGVRDELLWVQVAEHFALTIAYSQLFAEDYRDLRAAKNMMYADLKGLNAQELAALYTGGERTAQRYNLGKPALQTFLEDYFGPSEAFDL